jgi:nucleotide-binding universal stress UspA family protein
MKVSKILAPVDFSAGSRIAVEYAVALAKALNSTVTLFHAHEMPGSMNSIVPGADNEVDAGLERAAAMQRLEAMRAEMQKETDVEIRVMVQRGSPAKEIVSYSLSGGFDMIVMGTHGRTGLKRVVMGSVAEAVVRRALCPILTVHLPIGDIWA